MVALTSARYFALALIVLTTTISADDNECVLVDKIISTTCKAVENQIKQDNGKLGQQMCDCFTTFMKADLSYCQPDNYDFADAPMCGKLFKSNAFREISSSSNKLAEYFTNDLFKNIFGICSGKSEEMIMKSVNSMFKEGPIANGLEGVAQTGLPTDVASSFIQCYREFRKLAQGSV